MNATFLLFAAVQASPGAPPPRAVPFDCSWIYNPPAGPRERFEGVYTSFIDNGGFYPCSSANACRNWIGRAKEEVAFAPRAGAQFRKRANGIYGVFKIVFEGRRGNLGHRPGCKPHRWSLNPTPAYYVQIEKVLSVKWLEETKR
jgi:hypothetical protein